MHPHPLHHLSLAVDSDSADAANFVAVSADGSRTFVLTADPSIPGPVDRLTTLPPELVRMISDFLYVRRERIFLMCDPETRLPILHRRDITYFGHVLAFAEVNRTCWDIIREDMWTIAIKDIPNIPVEWTFHRAAGCGNNAFIELALLRRPLLFEKWDNLDVWEDWEERPPPPPPPKEDDDEDDEDEVEPPPPPPRKKLPGVRYRRPCFVAARHGLVGTFELLCESGDLWSEIPNNSAGTTVLTYAAASHNLDMVKAAMEEMGDTKYPSDFNDPGFTDTPLQWAACMGNLDIVKYLVSLGADPKFATASGENLLHWLAERRCQIGSQKTITYGDTSIPQDNQVLVAEYLLENGCNVKQLRTEEGVLGGDIPLTLAIRHGNVVMTGLLLRPAHYNPKDRFNFRRTNDTILHHAARFNPRLNRDVDTTPQYAAYASCFTQVLQLQASLPKPLVDARNRRNETPLHCAVEQMNIIAIRALVLAGADVSLRRKDMMSVGHLFVRGYKEAYMLLSQNDADFRWIDVCAGQILELLVGRFGSMFLNFDHPEHGRPLNMAVKLKDYELVAMLTLFGANPLIPSQMGDSPHDQADELGWEDGKVKMEECHERVLDDVRKLRKWDREGGWLKKFVWDGVGETLEREFDGGGGDEDDEMSDEEEEDEEDEEGEEAESEEAESEEGQTESEEEEE